MSDEQITPDLMTSLLNTQPAPKQGGRIITGGGAAVAQIQSGRAMDIPQRKRSAVVRQSEMQRATPWLDRAAALVLLCGSYLGSVIALTGWVKPSFSGEFIFGFVVGYGIQILLTWIQWAHTPAHHLQGISRAKRIFRVLRQLNWRYTMSVIVGVGFSVAGYAALILPWLKARAEGLGFAVGQQDTAAWVLIVLLALAVEMTPEIILVDD